MPTTGYQIAGTGSSVDPTSGLFPGPWTTPGNITAIDNTYATVTAAAFAIAPDNLQASNFGFALPTGASITGVAARIECSSSQSSISLLPSLVLSGASIGNVKTGTYPTSESAVVFGGSTDLWGATLTATNINSSTFGVSFSTANGGFKNANLSVDSIEIEITYTQPGTLEPATITATATVSADITGTTVPVDSTAGSFAVFSDSVTGQSIGATATTIAFDTVDSTTLDATLASNVITVGAPGLYAIGYSTQIRSTLGFDRSQVESWIEVNGTPQVLGRAYSYIRRETGSFEEVMNGTALLNLSRGDLVELVAQWANNFSTVETYQDVSLYMLKMDDTWSYASGVSTGSQNSQNSYSDIDFTTGSVTGTDITYASNAFTLATAGHYLITTTGDYNNSSSSTRTSAAMQWKLGGAVVPGTYHTVYLRGSDAANNGATGTARIIETTTSNVSFILEHRTSASAISLVGAEAGVAIVKLPDDGDYIRLDEATAGTNVDSTTPVAIGFDTQREVDTAEYTHSTSVNPSRVTFNSNSAHLFFGAGGTEQTANNRNQIRYNLRLNGSTVSPWAFGGYMRGTTVFAQAKVGHSGSGLLYSVNTNDYIELTASDTGTATTGVETSPNTVALDGVALSSIFDIIVPGLTYDSDVAATSVVTATLTLNNSLSSDVIITSAVTTAVALGLSFNTTLASNSAVVFGNVSRERAYDTDIVTVSNIASGFDILDPEFPADIVATSTVSAVLDSSPLIALNVSITTSVASSVARERSVNSTVAVTSNVNVVDIAVDRIISSAVTVATTVVAQLIRDINISADVNGNTTVDANVIRTAELDTTVTAVSTLSAPLRVERPFATTVTTVATVVAPLSRLLVKIAELDVVSTVSAGFAVDVLLSTSVVTTSTVAVALQKNITIVTSINATSSVSSNVIVDRPLAASINATSSLSSNLVSDNDFDTTINILSVVSGVLRCNRDLTIAPINVTSITSATLDSQLLLAASINATSSVSSNVIVDRPLAASINATSSLSSNLVSDNDFDTTINILSVVSGVLRSGFDFDIQAVNVTTLTNATLDSQPLLATSINATSSVSSNVIVDRPLATTINATSSVSSNLVSGNDFDTTINILSVVSGVLRSNRDLAIAPINCNAIASATLDRQPLLATTINNAVTVNAVLGVATTLSVDVFSNTLISMTVLRDVNYASAISVATSVGADLDNEVAFSSAVDISVTTVVELFKNFSLHSDVTVASTVAGKLDLLLLAETLNVISSFNQYVEITEDVFRLTLITDSSMLPSVRADTVSLPVLSDVVNMVSAIESTYLLAAMQSDIIDIVTSIESTVILDSAGRVLGFETDIFTLSNYAVGSGVVDGAVIKFTAVLDSPTLTNYTAVGSVEEPVEFESTVEQSLSNYAVGSGVVDGAVIKFTAVLDGPTLTDYTVVERLDALEAFSAAGLSTQTATELTPVESDTLTTVDSIESTVLLAVTPADTITIIHSIESTVVLGSTPSTIIRLD